MPSTPAVRAALGVASVTVLTAGIVAVTVIPAATPAAAEGLRPYQGCGSLLAHYREELRRSATPWSVGKPHYPFMAEDNITLAAPGGAPAAAGSAAAPNVGRDESTTSSTGTNVQEAGVDEPDTAKIARGLIVTFLNGRLRIVRAGAQPELLSTTNVGEASGHGGELLIDGDRVLVLLTEWRNTEHPDSPASSSPMVSEMAPGEPVTTAVLYDVADPAKPRRLEQYSIDGQYLSARLSDGRVRLVTSSTASARAVQPAAPHGDAENRAALAENQRRAGRVTLDDVLPRAVRRDGSGRVLAEERALGCTSVRHASEPRGASTLVVTTLDVRSGLTPTDTTGVTAQGDLVYATADRLYVATSRWDAFAGEPWFGGRPAPATATATPGTESVTTEIHAFTTSAGRTTYLGSGSVGGHVLGRWAFSFHGGHLRVATTRQPVSAPAADPTTSSSVFVLAERDGKLVETGRVDGLGPGERIYAVRYFGDIATVVTFRQTDPLYVVDLSDPAAPKVRGELKIPGFSTYLHPLGDDLLLGVGQDADLDGRVTGMQLSVFDLSDLAKPRQVHRLPLGAGHSPALGESRAFGYDPARRLALLPFGTYHAGAGSMVALGVRVGEDGRLTEAGRLQTATEGVDRVLHDADHVYAIGYTGIVAGSAPALRRTGAVSFR